MATLPSSHGSLDGEGAEVPEPECDNPSSQGDDGFDSGEFREWMRQRADRRRGDQERSRRSQRRADREHDSDEALSSGDKQRGSGNGPPPPEWDGSSMGFQDWLIKARLWLATTRSKPRTQGPMILQRLSGQPFQSLKHLAKDKNWLNNENNGQKILDLMDTPELFGEDREEELLAALSKLTYHLKRARDEPCRAFFARWDYAVRKIKEHNVVLPEKYLGFLLINALTLSEADIKAMLAFTQGAIDVKDVKSWCRKHEMKLLAKEVGAEKSRSGGAKTNSVYSMGQDDEDYDDDELLVMEELYRELYPGEDGQSEIAESDLFEDGELMEEHEAKELLSTMIAHKKKTFMQSLKTKKAKALARGYGQWRDKGSGGRGNGGGLSTAGYVKGGYYRMSLSEAKAKSRCAKCNQVGHWHRDPECPKNQGTSNNNKPKDVNYIEKKPISDSEEGLFCGLLEDPGRALRLDQSVLSETLKVATESFMSGNPDSSSSHDGHFGLEQNGDFSNGQQAESSNFVRDYKDHGHGSCFVGNEVFVGPGVLDDFGFDWNRRKVEHDVYWSDEKKSEGSDISSDDLCATIDTGCQRMAIGLETLKHLDAALPDGLQTNLVPQEHRFRSVHGTSTTKFVAVIPTSLGTKGSLLRPAVFDNKESRQAPFLISLPFLLHCRAVIHLDPKQGLRIYFKRFGFAVKCHIGPTGALRVPLSEFSGKNLETVKQAQEAFQENCKEFELLRTTTVFERDSGSRPSAAHFVPTSDVGYGVQRCDQTATSGGGRGGGAPSRLAQNGVEDPHGDGECDGDDYEAVDAPQGEPTEAIFGLAHNGLPNPEDSGCREPWQLSPDRGGGRRQRRSPVRHFPEVQLGDTDLTGAKLHRVSDGRHEVDSQRPGLGVDGAAAILPSSGGSSPMDDTQVGPQLRQNLLALSEGPRKPVQLLRMDSTSTNLAPSGPSDEHRDSIIAGDSINAGDITTAEGNQVFTINARSYLYGKSEDNYEQVSSQKCDPTGEHGNNHSGEVQGLRQGLEEGTTRCGVREQQLADQEFQDDQEGEGRIQGVPGIPGVPEVAEGKQKRDSESEN